MWASVVGGSAGGQEGGSGDPRVDHHRPFCSAYCFDVCLFQFRLDKRKNPLAVSCEGLFCHWLICVFDNLYLLLNHPLCDFVYHQFANVSFLVSCLFMLSSTLICCKLQRWTCYTDESSRPITSAAGLHLGKFQIAQKYFHKIFYSICKLNNNNNSKLLWSTIFQVHAVRMGNLLKIILTHINYT